MKKYCIIVICLACMVLLSSNGEKAQSSKITKNQNQQSEKGQRTVNLNLDKETAIKIAEIVLVKIYGERVLEQRPWIVTDNETDFKIEGTFHGNGLGGVAEIIISKADARIIHYIHGK